MTKKNYSGIGKFKKGEHIGVSKLYQIYKINITYKNRPFRLVEKGGCISKITRDNQCSWSELKKYMAPSLLAFL